MFYKLLVRVGIILALLFAFAAEFTMYPSTAHAAVSTASIWPTGCPEVCSISHYVNFNSYSTADSMLKNWAQADASRVDPPGDAGSCNNNYYSHNVVAILDFGSPNESGVTYGATNWYPDFYSESQLGDLAYDYASTYYADSGVCSRMWVTISVDNSVECNIPGYSAGCVYNAGYYLAAAVNILQDEINNAGIQAQFVEAGGDDIEYDGTWNWDTYNMTKNALDGFKAYPTSYWMIDYGYTQQPCGDYRQGNVCGGGGTTSSPTATCGNSSCGNPIWDYGEVYNVAWGIGLDVPLPEAYYCCSYGWGQIWGTVVTHSNNGTCTDCINGGPIYFWGVMSGYSDPSFPAWNDPDHDYANFFSGAGTVNHNSYYWDTCMNYSPWGKLLSNGKTSYTWPCY